VTQRTLETFEHPDGRQTLTFWQNEPYFGYSLFQHGIEWNPELGRHFEFNDLIASSGLFGTLEDALADALREYDWLKQG